MIPPLNGTKTHPLTQHAVAALRSLTMGPLPAQTINPGVINRLMRSSLIEIVSMPSPYGTGRGKSIQHAKITEQGRQELEKWPAY